MTELEDMDVEELNSNLENESRVLAQIQIRDAKEQRDSLVSEISMYGLTHHNKVNSLIYFIDQLIDAQEKTLLQLKIRHSIERELIKRAKINTNKYKEQIPEGGDEDE